MNKNILTKMVIASLCCCTMLFAKTHLKDQIDPDVKAKMELEQQREVDKQKVKPAAVATEEVAPLEMPAEMRALKEAKEAHQSQIREIPFQGVVKTTFGNSVKGIKTKEGLIYSDSDQEKIDYYNSNPVTQSANNLIKVNASPRCSDITLTVGGGTWDSEISWELSDGSAGGAGTFTLCLDDGDYTFTGYDSYGDGWNGGSFSFSDENGVFATGAVDGGSGSWTITVGGAAPVAGCTDPYALNHNADATVDDGSCSYECIYTTCGYYISVGYTCEDLTGWGYDCSDCSDQGACPVFGCTDDTADNYNPDATDNDGSCTYPCAGLLVDMADSYGDGWTGNTLVIGDESFTCSSSAAQGCYTGATEDVAVTCDGGSWQSEVSWTISDADGNVLLSGGAPYSGVLNPSAPVTCDDDSACNTGDEGDCSYADAGYNCDGSIAEGYHVDCVGNVASDALLSYVGDGYCDDGSWGVDYQCCDFNFDDGDCGATIGCDGVAIDCGGLVADECGECGGDGSSCAGSCSDITLTVGGGTWDSEISWELSDGSAGGAGTFTLCLDDGDYTFTGYDSYGDGWNGGSATFTDADGTIIASFAVEGASGSTTVTIGGAPPVAGCTDPGAPNYNADATVDDGSCEAYCNPNESGSCGYWLASGLGYTCEELTSYGYDCSMCADECPVVGCTDETADNYNPDATADDGSCAYTCASFTVSMCDSYGDGWNGNTLVIGDASFAATSGDPCEDVCYDGPVDVVVTCDGGSWQSEVSWTISDGDGVVLEGGAPYSGCLGNCDSAVFGCTDAAACNYDADATADDGSCSYPSLGCECDSVDSDGDGVCDDALDCYNASWYADGYCDSSNNTAECNYDGGDCCPGDCVDANYECATYGGDCTDCINADSADNQEGGECYSVESGCTDSYADNYNPDATDDDGSCLYNGCAAGFNLGCSEQDEADGDCASETWIGDGYCDGYDEAYGVNFCCYDNDGGDCTDAECAPTPDWDASITGLTAEGQDFLDPYYYAVPAVAWDWDDLSDGTSCEDNGEVTCYDGSCAATSDDCPEEPYPGCAGTLSWISDGYCDATNNNAECGFDGGDCCPGECEDAVADGCPDNPDGCYSTISCGDCASCLDADSPDLAVGGACEDYVQWSDADCAATVTIAGSTDLDGDGYSDDCYDDGTGYFSFSWDGGCTATNLFYVDSDGVDQDLAIAEYGFTSGLIFYGFGQQEEIPFILSFGEASYEGAATTDCADEPLSCADQGGYEDCSGDGDCAPASWVGDGWCDGTDQPYGYDLTCYDNDGGDCDDAAGDDGGDGGDDGCVNDDSTADSYGDTCSSWYDAMEGPGSSGCTGAYDDDDFSAATQCCACQEDGRSADSNPSIDHQPLALSNNSAVNAKVFAAQVKAYKHSLVTSKKVNEVAPVMLNIATGEISYSSNSTANRAVSYTVNVSCDACVDFDGDGYGEAWSNTWTTSVSEFLVYGFVDGSDVCATVTGVSDVLGITATSDPACATSGEECEFFDCIGQEACGYESWVGDGYCDDGSFGMYFDCEEFENDGGDCAPACTAGDSNSDGILNVLDIVASVNYIVSGGENASEGFSVECADFDGDGVLNVLDIVASVNVIVGNTRASDATDVKLIKSDNALNINANGYVGGVQMTLSHGSDFSITLTDKAMTAAYNTSGNKTTLVIVAPESNELFVANGEYEIDEMIIANSAYEINASVVPGSFELSQAYPNPFNPSTTINLSIPEAGFVSVQVYNVMGQLVSTLSDGYMDAGYNTMTWDAGSFSSGLYLITATTANNSSTQKVMLLK